VYTFRCYEGNTFLLSAAYDDNLLHHITAELPTRVRQETYGVRYAPKTKEEEEEEKAAEEGKEGEVVAAKEKALFGKIQLNSLNRRIEMRRLIEENAQCLKGVAVDNPHAVTQVLLHLDKKRNSVEEGVRGSGGMDREDQDGDEAGKEKDEYAEEEGVGEDDKDEEESEDEAAQFEDLINTSRLGTDKKFAVDDFLKRLLIQSEIAEDVVEVTKEEEDDGLAAIAVTSVVSVSHKRKIKIKKYADYVTSG
jgi:hypothetical protein